MNQTNDMSVHCTYEVRWKNFKGFVDTGWKKIKPITILIGSNNSGKTSFIAPLLLMNQTIFSIDSQSPFVLKGDVYDGGSMSEISHDYNTENDIFFGLRYHTHIPPSNLKAVGAYPPGAIEVTFGKNRNKSSLIKDDFVIRKYSIYDMYERHLLTLSRNDKNEYEISGIENLSDTEIAEIKSVKAINYIFSPNTFLYNSSSGKRTKHSEGIEKAQFSKGFEQLLKIMAANYTQVREMISDISYLGPIREHPHRYYEISEEVFSTVGSRGENTASLLRKNKNKIKNELNEWVQRFGFGDELILKPLSQGLYSIYFKNNKLNRLTSISNTGFGASQILPLLVQALIADTESITIAEQPEIHLNPKYHGVLGDLFGYMAKKDKRIIVETHSEHILLRLRKLIANKTITPDEIAVYFIEKKDDNSVIREIPIDEAGRIDPKSWPSDFFNDSLKESLALVTEQSKLKK